MWAALILAQRTIKDDDKRASVAFYHLPRLEQNAMENRPLAHRVVDKYDWLACRPYAFTLAWLRNTNIICHSDVFPQDTKWNGHGKGKAFTGNRVVSNLRFLVATVSTGWEGMKELYGRCGSSFVLLPSNAPPRVSPRK